jgi:hypothetical protein
VVVEKDEDVAAEPIDVALLIVASDNDDRGGEGASSNSSCTNEVGSVCISSY